MNTEIFKESHPCKHCGDTRRYIKSGSCPTCKALNQRRYRAAKTGCKPSRPYKARVALPNPTKPVTEPQAQPTGLLTILFKIFTAPLKIFQSSCKWIAA